MDPTAVPLESTILSLGLVGGFFDWDWETDASKLESEAGEALERASFGGEARFSSAPAVDDVATVNTHRDGDPIYVPVVEVALASDDPDLDAAYRITGAIVTALESVFADEHVRHYDVLFALGDSSWWETADRRRIAVTPDLVARLGREPSFDARDLRRAIEERDDGDDEIPPVAWGEPLDNQYYSERSSGDWAAYGTGGWM